MHQQALRFQSDPRRDEGLGRHANGCRHGARQTLLGAADLAGVVGHLMPLGEAFLRKLLEAFEALQCRGNDGSSS